MGTPIFLCSLHSYDQVPTVCRYEGWTKSALTAFLCERYPQQQREATRGMMMKKSGMGTSCLPPEGKGTLSSAGTLLVSEAKAPSAGMTQLLDEIVKDIQQLHGVKMTTLPGVVQKEVPVFQRKREAVITNQIRKVKDEMHIKKRKKRKKRRERKCIKNRV